jgi:acetyltransferase-like isoleucine patch superfamily enzyme
MKLRRRLHAATEAVAATRLWTPGIVRPERFGTFGEGSVIEPPLRVVSPERVHVGRNVRIRPNAWLSVAGTSGVDDGGPLLSIGDRTMLGADLVIACAGHVEIGPDVLTSDRVFIGDTYHEYRDVDRPIQAQGLAPPRPVLINAGAFIGIGAMILPGVTVGENAYVGAGAVVTHDVPARCVAVGNPARVVSHWDSSTREWRRGAPPFGAPEQP